MAIERHYRILSNIQFHYGRCWPLDLALWDLAGKITGQPVWKLLGGLSGRYVVVVDGPQVPGPVPSNQLLSMADATLVVVTEGSTAVRDARFTGDARRAASTNPVGAVILKR